MNVLVSQLGFEEMQCFLDISPSYFLCAPDSYTLHHAIIIDWVIRSNRV